MGSATQTTTDADFTSDVLQSDKPVLEEIAAENSDKLKVVKLNIDENPGAARDYQIMSIPTMAVFQDGKIVKQIVGAKPKAAILKDLESYL
jgi:thioredoxin 1